MNNTVLVPVLCAWSFLGFGPDPFKGQDTIGDLDEDSVVIPDAAETQASREKALELYRQYLENPEGDTQMRLEAMRRMGDLNIEAGQNAEYGDNPGGGAAYHSEAIVLYKQLLESEEGHESSDLVLYQLSRAYESLGDLDNGLATLNRLVAEFPSSRYINEAQFRRGEVLFVRRNYYEAGLAYQHVVEAGETSTYYEQSLYKLGWSLFKQGEYDPAIHSFLDLLNRRMAAADERLELKLPETPAAAFDEAALAQTLTSEAIALQARFDSMSRPEKELVDDTLRALSLTFSYMEGPTTIGEYLDARADENDPGYLLYTHLGDLYLAKERYLDAAETFTAFVVREPYHHNAPELSNRAIKAYEEGRFPTKVLEGKRAYIRVYGLDSEYWTYHDPAKRGDVVALLKVNLTDLAEYDHAEAQRTGDPEAYARAAEWYRRYLDYFPTDPDSAKRSFLLGEVLMESGKFAEANTYYLRAAYDYPEYENAAESGYAALLASRAHLEALEANEAFVEEAAEWKIQQLFQASRFTWSFREHEQTDSVLSDTAIGFFGEDELDEAMVVAGQLLIRDEPAEPALTRVAWTIVGHSHFDLEQFPRAEKAYLALRDMGDSGRGDAESFAGLSAEEIDERIAASIYRQAETAVAAADIDAAVIHFLRVEKVAPTASIAAQSTYDGSVLLFTHERYEQSIEVMLGFRITYPGHVYSNDITRNLAVAYQRTEQPLKAAVEYEAIVAFSLEDIEVRREAMYTAADLYQTGGDLGNSRRVWSQYVGEFPDPVAEAIEIRQVLADLATEDGDPADRIVWLKDIIAADAVAGEQRTERTRTLAGRATLELAEPERLAFNQIRLAIPLAESLQRKKAAMESALEYYNAAAGYEIAEITTVATYRIGELYQLLSADLMDSERPKGLNDDELEQYEILLEEQAFPFEEKAITVYEANVARVPKGIWDEWVVQSYAQLAVLMPGRYAKYEKAEDHVAQLY